jgi:hypothetical protein
MEENHQFIEKWARHFARLQHYKFHNQCQSLLRAWFKPVLAQLCVVDFSTPVHDSRLDNARGEVDYSSFE